MTDTDGKTTMPYVAITGADTDQVSMLIEGQPAVATWTELRMAAWQDDPAAFYELTGRFPGEIGARMVAMARVYRHILHWAEVHARCHSPLVVEVCHDHTNVRYVVRVRTRWGNLGFDPATVDGTPRDINRSYEQWEQEQAIADARAFAGRIGSRLVQAVTW